MDRRLTEDALDFAALLGGAALFYLSRSWVVALVGLALFVLISWARLELAALAVIVFVPYFTHPKSIFGHHAFPPSEWLLFAVVGVAALATITSSLGLGGKRPEEATDHEHISFREVLARYRFPRSPSWHRLFGSPFVTPGLLFLAVATLSTALASQRHLAARDLLEVILEPLLLFVVLLLFTPEDENGRRRTFVFIGVAVVLTGLVPSLIAIGQLVTGQHLVVVNGAAYKRVPGPYPSPDNLGLLLDRTIPMTLALLLAAWTWHRRTSKGINHRDRKTAPGDSPVQPTVEDVYSPSIEREFDVPQLLVLAVSLVAMGIALIATFVLGAWLGTSIAVVAILLVRLKPGWWVVAGVAVILVLAVALGSTKAHSVTAGVRVNIWTSAIHMIRDHPILGIGMDNFQHYYAPRHGDGVGPHARSESGRCNLGLGYMEPAASNEPCLSHPHNAVFDLWLSTGILGLLAFIWLQWVFWRIVWQRRRFLTIAPVLLGAGGAMLASLLHGLVDNVYFLVDLSLLMWLLFAIASLSQGTDDIVEHGPIPSPVVTSA